MSTSTRARRAAPLAALALPALTLAGIALPGLARAQSVTALPDQVSTIRLSASSTRSAIAWALNPPKITEWIAPIRAQASIAIASSGTMPM